MSLIVYYSYTSLVSSDECVRRSLLQYVTLLLRNRTIELLLTSFLRNRTIDMHYNAETRLV